MEKELYLKFLVTGCGIALLLPYVLERVGYSFKLQLKLVSGIAVFLSPVVGYFTGTLYTHGFDVPWWLFGIAYGVGLIVCFLFGFLILRLIAIGKGI